MFSDALLVYHNTPIGLGLPTPAELMYHHRVKTDLPLVYPQQQNIDQSRAMYAASYLKTAVVPKYSGDELVWIQDPVTKLWQDDEISAVSQKPERYFVTVNKTQKIYECNLRFIRPHSLNHVQEQPFSPVQTP